MGPFGGTEDTPSLSRLLVADRCNVEDGFRVVNIPAIQVGRTSRNFQYPLLIKFTGRGSVAEVLHPGVTTFNSDHCEFAGSLLDGVGSIA